MHKFNLIKRSNSSLITKAILFLGLFILSIHINQKFFLPVLKINPEIHSLNPNTSLLFINGGLKRMISSLMWVKTLLDADLERNFNLDTGSWLYLRFNTIATLDPFFLINYQYGGKYLSIIKDDLKSAEKLFLKGLTIYPEDYSLNYDLAFLYFNELNQPNKAIPYLLKIRKSPKAPAFINALIATLMIKNNISPEQVISFLQAAMQETQDELLLNLYQTKINKIKNPQ